MAVAISYIFSDWLKTALGPHDPVPMLLTVKTSVREFLRTAIDSLLYFEGEWPRSIAIELLLMFLGVLFYFMTALILVAISRFIATVVSRLLGTVLDHLAWDQIRASAYGNDTRAENAQSAADTPSSFGPQPPLPQSLAAEISKFADSAVAASASKFRASFNRLAFAQDKRERSDLVSEYLTWDELIHTAYFKVPVFKPDYSRVAAWYAELTCDADREQKDGTIEVGSKVKQSERAISS
jgi:Na+-transporting methylmalonyl-CoA/oxaloacetate decarboxylase gamma subunit